MPVPDHMSQGRARELACADHRFCTPKSLACDGTEQIEQELYVLVWVAQVHACGVHSFRQSKQNKYGRWIKQVRAPYQDYA